MLLRLIAAVLTLTLSLPLAFCTDSPEGTLRQQPQSFKREITRVVGAEYLLYLPKGYDAKDSRRWPLVLFLHGAGERGSDIKKVAAHGPPKLVQNGREFPFILVSPQCPAGERWSDEVLLGLLDHVIKHHRVDLHRVYLTGLSMGGFGTWSLGLKYPERFAAIAPVCGGGTIIDVRSATSGKLAALKSLGIWAFHGAKDSVVKLEESERMVAAAKQVGIEDVKLTIYPEAKHDSWTETYANPELYDWLLKHERK